MVSHCCPPRQGGRDYHTATARHDKPFAVGHLWVGGSSQFRVGCPAIKVRIRGGAMNNAIVIRGQLRIPEWVKDLDSFHRWTESPGYPDSGWFSYFRGEIWVDNSLETMNHNQAKGAFAITVGGLVLSERLGRYLHDR